MPLIRCDYSKELVNDEVLRQLNRAVYEASAELCRYSEEDARNKISIFNTPFGEFDHSTAAAEIEIRVRLAEFDRPPKSREEVRKEWLERYQAGLIPLARKAGLAAPIILTVTLEDWEVVVITGEGVHPNAEE